MIIELAGCSIGCITSLSGSLVTTGFCKCQHQRASRTSLDAALAARTTLYHG
jgi:hypothetical protein